MNNFKIRNAVIQDVDDLLRLEKDYGEDAYSREMIVSTFDYDYYHTYVILVDNKIIGYISATIILEECNLIKIIIDKDYRKNGYGKILLNHLIKVCKELNVDKIFLEVREDNLIAKMFYQNIGFRCESKRLGYYDGVDAEIFWYYIND